MKVTEIPKKFGTVFAVSLTLLDNEEWPRIGTWLKENDISFIYNHVGVFEDEYFIRDEAGIMAFKLRWM